MVPSSKDFLDKSPEQTTKSTIEPTPPSRVVDRRLTDSGVNDFFFFFFYSRETSYQASRPVCYRFSKILHDAIGTWRVGQRSRPSVGTSRVASGFFRDPGSFPSPPAVLLFLFFHTVVDGF